MATKKTSTPPSGKKRAKKRVNPPTKQTGDTISTLAGEVLRGKKPTPAEAKSLAASVLSQDEHKGKRKK